MSGFNSGRTNTRGWLPAKLVMVGLACLSFALMGQAGCPLFPPPVVDTDGDGVADEDDNCPNTANADQADNDNDGLGNVCDPTPDGVTPPPSNDRDNDGIPNASDNCPDTANPDQADADNDGIGDVCDSTPTPPALTVDAGATQAATGGQTVVLTGLSGGGVPPVTFAWELVSGGTAGNVTLTNANTQTASATFSSDASGTFTFRVTGTDSAGQTATDTMTVTATPSGSATSLTFTLNVDDLVGTSGDDLFTAPSALTLAGAQASTLQNGDAADGMGGTDNLNAFIVGAAAQTIAATLTSIESMTVTDFSANGGAAGDTTLVGSNITGLTTFNLSGSTHGDVQAAGNDEFVVTNLPQLLTNIGLSNTTQDLDVQFATSATSAADDATTLSVSNSNTGTVANRARVLITSGGTNGIETLTVDSSGTANRLLSINQVNGTTMATLNITGDADLQIGDIVSGAGALDNSILTVNASTFTGDLTELTVGNGVVAFTGGDGDDTVIFGANYTVADTVNGGPGDDTLGLTPAVISDAVASTNQTNVTNIEGLRVVGADLNVAVTASRWGTIDEVTVDQGFNAGTITFAVSPATVNVGEFGTVNGDSAGAANITIAGLGGSDVLNLNINDADTGSATTINGAETVNLASNLNLNGGATDGTVNQMDALTINPSSGSATLNITGTEHLTFTGAITVATINASTFTKNLIMPLGTASTATTITGGSGNDTLVGSAGNDSLASGTGNNVLQGGTGIDTITFSAGNNILNMEDLNTAAMVAANRKIVSGFNADGSTFVLNSSAVDAIDFGNVTTANIGDGVVAAEFQTVSTPANVTVNATAGIVELAWEFSPAVNLAALGANELNGATLLSALGAASGTTAGTITTNANDDDIIIIAYQGGSAFIYHGNGAGGDTSLVAAEISLIAVINGGVSVGGFDFSQFVD